ncbi:MAG TPA: hypothetical protein VI455_17055 [Terriglobia bacterium]
MKAGRRDTATRTVLARTGRLAAVAALLLVCGAWVWAVPKKKKAAPPEDPLVKQVGDLARQLWGVPLDESAPLTSQIEKLVLDHMGQWLQTHSPGPNPPSKPNGMPYEVQVRREIERLFSDLRPPLYADADTFDQPFGQSRLIAVGYSLGWSDYDRANVVALFEASAGPGAAPVQPVAVTHFVPDTDLYYQFLHPPPGRESELWFVVYGTRLGKSHPRLSAVLYAFDGKTLQPLWQTTDVYDGQISFAGARVVISYLKEDELTEAIAAHSPAVRHEAAYHVGPKGLELEYDR